MVLAVEVKGQLDVCILKRKGDLYSMEPTTETETALLRVQVDKLELIHGVKVGLY